jgi:hypothetical protein
LKRVVKDHAQQTQQWPDLFAQQCALQEYETNLLSYVMSDIDGQHGLSPQTISVSTNVVIPKGKFTLNMSTTNKSGVGVFLMRYSGITPRENTSNVVYQIC